MSNYPKELIDLVKEYLTDGVISAKERQVLLKKAVTLGVDPDEFDLYIEAQQQKVDQAVDAAASMKRGATCPFCGGPIPQLTEKCPHCGELITAQASEELQEILEQLEDALVNLKSGRSLDENKAKVERYSRKAELYYSHNPKIQRLIEAIRAETIEAEKKVLAKAREEEKKAADKARKEEKKAAAEARSEAIQNAGNWFWDNIITNPIVLYLIFAVSFGYWLFHDDETTDAKMCSEAIVNAITEKDLEKAYGLIQNFEKDKTQLNGACHQLAEAYIEIDEYEKALNSYSGSETEKSWSKSSDIRKKIYNIYLSKENYEEAEDLYNWNEADYYGHLCRCIDAMLSKNPDVNKISSFVKYKTDNFKDYIVNKEDKDSEWNSTNVYKRLLEYIKLKK